MTEEKRTRSNGSAVKVLGASMILAGLSLSLGVRLYARTAVAAPAGTGVTSQRPVPPPAMVPEPKRVSLADLPTPHCWSCKAKEPQSLDFRVDLDILAPLGDGEANMGVFLRDFAKHDGVRRDEKVNERRQDVRVNGTMTKAFSGDDPLVLEAEPWVDQSICRFYPDFFEVTGLDTPITNLLFPLLLARSRRPAPHAAQRVFPDQAEVSPVSNPSSKILLGTTSIVEM